MSINFTVFQYLARSFFPSWKFFEELKYVVRLEWFKEDFKTSSRSEYFRMLKKAYKKQIFFNERINLELAKLSLLEQFVAEASQTAPEKIVDLVTYKCIEQWVIDEYNQATVVEIDPKTIQALSLRFRILLYEEESEFSKPIEFLTSNPIEVTQNL